MGEMLKNKNNGKSQPAGYTPAGNTAGRYFENLAHNTEFPNVLKELIKIGADPRDLLMRTYFSDERRANQAVRLLMKFQKFNMSLRFYTMVLNKLAANCSLGGMSRAELVMSHSGVVDSEYVESAARQRSGSAFPKSRHEKGEKRDKDEE